MQSRDYLKGIALPPSGWSLAILLCLYLFTGLVGHDPWKVDDAISIGVAFDMVKNGRWFIPHLAGQPYPDAPLYYWIAAAFSSTFSWLLPAHDASRLASGLCALLALEFILLAARELYGKDFAAAAPLTLAGSIGFLFHTHEAQPMLAALMAHAAAYWALALTPRQPRFATAILGLSLATTFLADGLLPLATLLPTVFFALYFSKNRLNDFLRIIGAFFLASILCAFWLAPLQSEAPAIFSAFMQREFETINLINAEPLNNGWRYLKMLLWYAWPALPLAVWALWAQRRMIRMKAFALPACSFVVVLLILSFCVPRRSSVALLFLPPLVLLAVPGVASLRRGAANAFDWFSMVMFTFLAGIAWIVWSALVFGWPERLARQAVRLEPGFVGYFTFYSCIYAIAVTLIWLWLIATTPHKPMRSIMHWMAGLTLFWILVAVLWMPWIDYGKSYRPVSASLAKALSRKTGCIVNANLPNSFVAILDYFDGIQTIPLASDAGSRCNLLVIRGGERESASMASSGWRKVWEEKRPGDRHNDDKYRLYQRSARSRPTTSLPADIGSDENAPSGDEQ